MGVKVAVPRNVCSSQTPSSVCHEMYVALPLVLDIDDGDLRVLHSDCNQRLSGSTYLLVQKSRRTVQDLGRSLESVGCLLSRTYL